MQSYEQSLRLFERWCIEEGISKPEEVRVGNVRKYICDLEERGKYTFYVKEEHRKYNYPERRRDYREEISITTINNYIRNLKAFYSWYSYEENTDDPMKQIRQLKNERKPQEYLSDEEINKLLKIFDLSYFSEHRDYVIILLLLDSGMRIGECLKIQIKDLDLCVIGCDIFDMHSTKEKASLSSLKRVQQWVENILENF